MKAASTYVILFTKSELSGQVYQQFLFYELVLIPNFLRNMPTSNEPTSSLFLLFFLASFVCGDLRSVTFCLGGMHVLYLENLPREGHKTR